MNRRCLAPLFAALLFTVTAGCPKSPDCRGDAKVCAGSCVELASDNLNCGACGNACEPGLACSHGTCAVTCAADLLDCGGHCIDPDTDRTFCGASGSCAGPAGGEECGEGQLCSAGLCAQGCSAPQVACPVADPTYCAELGRDANNCGACGNVCPGGQRCSGGTCACPAARPDACGAGDTAFCTDFASDPLHCGDCDTACGPGTACSGSQCVTSCPALEYACSGRCVDPLSDPLFCGAASDCTGGAVCGAGSACHDGECAPVMGPEFTLGYAAAFPTQDVTASSANFLLGQKVIVPEAAWLYRLGVVMRLADTDRGRMAVYTDVAGRPGARVAFTDLTNLPAGAVEMSVVGAPILLQAGTYWLMANYSGDTSPSATTVGAAANTIAYVALSSANPLPTTFPTASVYTGQLLAYYMVLR